jgi:hypothetical protein
MAAAVFEDSKLPLRTRGGGAVPTLSTREWVCASPADTCIGCGPAAPRLGMIQLYLRAIAWRIRIGLPLLSAVSTPVAPSTQILHVGCDRSQLCFSISGYNGPRANSIFHHQPNSDAWPKSKLEAAYHKADASIRNVIELLEAA